MLCGVIQLSTKPHNYHHYLFLGNDGHGTQISKFARFEHFSTCQVMRNKQVLLDTQQIMCCLCKIVRKLPIKKIYSVCDYGTHTHIEIQVVLRSWCSVLSPCVIYGRTPEHLWRFLCAMNDLSVLICANKEARSRPLACQNGYSPWLFEYL